MDMQPSTRSAAYRSLFLLALTAFPACAAERDDAARGAESSIVAGPAVVARPAVVEEPAVCISSAQCGATTYCTTEDGVCNTAPGLADVCAGTCAPRP